MTLESNMLEFEPGGFPYLEINAVASFLSKLKFTQLRLLEVVEVVI
jgi:hypothetical protein